MQLKPLADLLRHTQTDRYFLLTLHFAGASHAIVLDNSYDSPGFFDPNIGFVAINRDSKRDEAMWLLSLFLIKYDVNRVDIWAIR